MKIIEKLMSKKAFTLIELILAIAILYIIVLASARILMKSSEAISIGSKQTIGDSIIRTVMDSIIDDLMQAVAYKSYAADRPSATFRREYRKAITYANDLICDRLTFQALLGPEPTPSNPLTKYSIKTVCYKVDSTEDQYGTFWILKRGIEWGAKEPSEINTYPIVNNIVEFRVGIIDTNGVAIPNTENIVWTRLPGCVQIYISVLTDTDRQRVRMFPAGSPEIENFVKRQARRYYTSVYLPLSMGYGGYKDYRW